MGRPDLELVSALASLNRGLWYRPCAGLADTEVGHYVALTGVAADVRPALMADVHIYLPPRGGAEGKRQMLSARGGGDARRTREENNQPVNIEALLELMVSRGASDLHLKAASLPTLRVDGNLQPLEDHAPLTPDNSIQILHAIATPTQLQRIEATWELDFAYSIAGLARFRVNAAYQRGSVALSFRAISIGAPNLESLGLPSICETLAARQHGLVIVTGPTGAGKSTTLAAMLDYINRRERRRIITVEDPIEFLHPDRLSMVVQREVGSDTRDFPSAIRAALRQDPNVILVGEMRDLETISVAITAAETGHLVLGTLHTMGAAQTVDRIVNVFPANQEQEIRTELSLCLEAVISQTLLPRLGGSGRVAAVEVMIGTPAVRNLIREAKTHQLPNAIAMGAQFGMQTLDGSLRDLVARRAVTLEEALLRASNPDELRQRLGNHEV